MISKQGSLRLLIINMNEKKENPTTKRARKYSDDNKLFCWAIKVYGWSEFISININLAINLQIK